MNRIKTAIVILFLVTSFCVCEFVYVGNTVNEFIGRLDEIEKTYANEDYEEALRLAKARIRGYASLSRLCKRNRRKYCGNRRLH